MRNYVRKNYDQEASLIGDNIVYAGFFTVMFYGYGLVDRDPGLVAIATGCWACYYALYAPFFVRSMALRNPPEDPWRAAAFVAWGALPFFLFIPFWSQLTAWPGSIATYPVVALWSVSALCVAGLSQWPRDGAIRRILFRSGGAIFAIAAGPVYLGFGFAGLFGAWTPPDDKFLSILAMFGSLPIAGMCVYAAVKLLGHANPEGAPLEQAS